MTKGTGILALVRANKIETVTILSVAGAIAFAALIGQAPALSGPEPTAQQAESIPELTNRALATASVASGESIKKAQQHTSAVANTAMPGIARSERISYRIDEAGYVDAYVAPPDASSGAIGAALFRDIGVEWREPSGETTRRSRGVDPNSNPQETAEAETAEVDFPRNEVITGRVLDRNGMPVPGVRLVVMAERLFDLPVGAPVPIQDVKHETISGGGGDFTAGPLAAGDYRVRALPPRGYSSAITSVRTGTGAASLVLETERDVRVVGQVQSTRGEPLAGVLVAPKVPGAVAGHSDDFGAFVLVVPISNSSGFALEARREGFEASVIHVPSSSVAGQDVSLEIFLEPIAETAMVAGVVRDTDGLPVPGKSVLLQSRSDQRPHQSRTDGGGRFVFQDIATGEGYSLRIHADRRHLEYLQSGLGVPAEGLTLAVNLDLRDTGTLSGRITNPEGYPVPDFDLELKNEGLAGRGVRVAADGAGNYFVDNAPTGLLVMQTRSMPRFNVSGITVKPGDDVTVEVVVDWGTHTIQGFVADPDGNPVPAAPIRLRWFYTSNGIRSWSSRETTADAQGQFIFNQLGSGPHTIFVDVPGFEEVRVEHDVLRDGYELVVQLGKRT